MSDLSKAVGGKQRIVGGPFGSKLTTRDYTDEGVPVIRGSNMEVNGRWIGGDFAFVSDQKAEKDLKSNVAFPGDIMVTQRGTLGQVSIIPEDGDFPFYVVSQSQMAISVDPELVNRDFVYYFLKSPEFVDYSHTQTIQTGVPHINLGILRDTPTSFPEKEVQREIAATLGALDDKIELNRKTAATLEEMARALYRSWFVDFDPVHAKAAGRAPAHMDAQIAALFPDRFGEDGLPEGWAEAKLGDMITRLKVGKLFSQKTVSESGKIPVLDQGKQGVIGFHDEEPNIVASSDRRVAVFANHTCVQRVLQEPFSTIQNVIPFIGRELPTEFCHYSSLGKQRFEEYRGHWPSFVEVKCSLPPKELAEEFAVQVSPWLSRLCQASNENQTLAALRDTLLPRLMSGELRVGEAKEQVEAVV